MACIMKTAWYGNDFRITGPLRGKSGGFLSQKSSNAAFLSWTYYWPSSRVVVGLRCIDAHMTSLGCHVKDLPLRPPSVGLNVHFLSQSGSAPCHLQYRKKWGVMKWKRSSHYLVLVRRFHWSTGHRWFPLQRAVVPSSDVLFVVRLNTLLNQAPVIWDAMIPCDVIVMFLDYYSLFSYTPIQSLQFIRRLGVGRIISLAVIWVVYERWSHFHPKEYIILIFTHYLVMV